VDLREPRPLTLEVRAREQVTPLVTRVVVGGDDLIGFEFAAGRGFAADDVSSKPYWRAGRANAAHGEPLRD
jgi:NADPH-dependent ferric siderophore reductase